MSLLKDTLGMDAVMLDYSRVPLLMDGLLFFLLFLSSVLSPAAWLDNALNFDESSLQRLIPRTFILLLLLLLLLLNSRSWNK